MTEKLGGCYDNPSKNTESPSKTVVSGQEEVIWKVVAGDLLDMAKQK